MKANILSLSLFMMATLAYAQEKTTIELPVSICGQTKWEASSTTVTLVSGQEEVAAWELQGFERHDGIQHSGKIFYIADDAEDRITLLFENVQISHEKRPTLIENLSKKELVIYMRGLTILNNYGAIIRSGGNLSIYGEEKDELDINNRVTIHSAGRNNRSAIEAVGTVSLQDLNLDMDGNKGLYGIRSMGKGEDGSLLILNHVKGKVEGIREATGGFDTIEGTNCTLEGVKLDISNEGNEEENEENDESVETDNSKQNVEEEAQTKTVRAIPVVGGDFVIECKVMGEHRFPCNLPEKEIMFQGQTCRAMILPVETEQGSICWVDCFRYLYFDNVKLTTDIGKPIVDAEGRPLCILFSGNNVIKCANDAFVGGNEMMLVGITRNGSDKLTVTTPKNAFKMKEGQKPRVERMTVKANNKIIK